MKNPSPARPWALVWVAAGASLWGTDTLFRRPLTASLSSPQIVLCEHLILTAILLPVLWHARGEWSALRPAEWAAVLGIAWGGSALGTVFFTEAVRAGNPTVAVFLQKLQPLFAALLAAAMLGEPLGPRFWAALVVALGGAYLVSFGDRPVFAALVPERVSAALFAIGAAALWGASTVLGRFALGRLSFVTLTALRIVCAAPLLAILASLGSLWPLAHLDSRRAASLLLMALVPGLAALLVYYRGLRATRASLAALAELSFPATAALLNWAFLGARLAPIQIAGFALVWGVIFYLDRVARARGAV